MRDVAIIGVGMTPVGEHWQSGLRMLAADAIQAALADADTKSVDALYVGNAYGATFSSQSHLGALVADYAGLSGIEAYTVEAADASGGAALRTAYMAVASGAVKTALVVGVEKSADAIAGARVEARAVSLDADFESIHGATLPALAGMLMRRYMHEYGVGVEVFEGFSVNAHANGQKNPLAMFRNTVRPGSFSRAPMVANPLNLFDGAPDADGAAALVLTNAERAADMVSQPVRIAGSAVATDTLALQDRSDLLVLKSVELSVQKAFDQVGIIAADVDLFELHDAFTILSTMTLEAAGFAERGKGWELAGENGKEIGLQGKLPISTFGGLKSRGNPAGAVGVYQAVEAALQLRGKAGDNQVDGAKTALIQNLGGIGSTAIAHILTV
jgi:acetyl-CoA C-acetyltransferase